MGFVSRLNASRRSTTRVQSPDIKKATPRTGRDWRPPPHPLHAPAAAENRKPQLKTEYLRTTSGFDLEAWAGVQRQEPSPGSGNSVHHRRSVSSAVPGRVR